MRGTVPKKEGFENNALYSDSTLAIDPTTGSLKWYRQHLPDDTWDMDYVYERMLIDLPVNGQTRRALVTSGKLGMLEAIDRTNGEWLWHKEMVYQNLVSDNREARVDEKPRPHPTSVPLAPRNARGAPPSPPNPGPRGGPATAYSPRTGNLYVPLNEFCSTITPLVLAPGQAYSGGG